MRTEFTESVDKDDKERKFEHAQCNFTNSNDEKNQRKGETK